jgi:hypothetical protein
MVYNCCKDSGLKTFDFMDYTAAIKIATSSIPKHINTSGMYESKAKDKKAKPMDEAKK